MDPRAHSQTVTERGSTSRARCNQGPRDDAISELALENSDEEVPTEGPVVVGRGCRSDQGRQKPWSSQQGYCGPEDHADSRVRTSDVSVEKGHLATPSLQVAQLRPEQGPGIGDVREEAPSFFPLLTSHPRCSLSARKAAAW